MYCLVKLQVRSLKGSWKKQSLIWEIAWRIQNERQLIRENLQTVLSKRRLIKIPRCGERLCFWKAAIFTNPAGLRHSHESAIVLPLLGTNLSEWLKIQKRDSPSCGPSFRNSCPSPLPHLPQRTCILSHVFNISILSGAFKQDKAQHHTDPLASGVPCRRWESPSSWWRCPPWWSPWRLATGTSGQTWSDWRTAGGYTGSIRTYLREAVLGFSVAFST